MRCVNCGRQAAADDSQCPYCGCPVLSRHDDPQAVRRAAHVRRLWDDAAEAPAAEVVPLYTAPRGLQPVDIFSEAAIWGVSWLLLAWLLGVVAEPATWAAAAVGLLVDCFVLATYNVRPWYHRLRRRNRPSGGSDDASRPAPTARVSGL